MGHPREWAPTEVGTSHHSGGFHPGISENPFLVKRTASRNSPHVRFLSASDPSHALTLGQVSSLTASTWIVRESRRAGNPTDQNPRSKIAKGAILEWATRVLFSQLTLTADRTPKDIQ
jgi:hypothetical protein